MKILLVALGGMLVAGLTGCTGTFISLYREKEVMPVQEQPAVVKAAFPWRIIPEIVGILQGPTKAAIENKVPYHETTGFTLLSVSTPDKHKLKRTKREGPYIVEFLEKERVRR